MARSLCENVQEEGPAGCGAFPPPNRLTLAAAPATPTASPVASAAAPAGAVAPAVPAVPAATSPYSFVSNGHLFTPFPQRGGAPKPRQLANATTLASIGY